MSFVSFVSFVSSVSIVPLVSVVLVSLVSKYEGGDGGDGGMVEDECEEDGEDVLDRDGCCLLERLKLLKKASHSLDSFAKAWTSKEDQSKERTSGAAVGDVVVEVGLEEGLEEGVDEEALLTGEVSCFCFFNLVEAIRVNGLLILRFVMSVRTRFLTGTVVFFFFFFLFILFFCCVT